MGRRLNGNSSFAYMGVRPSTPPQMVLQDRQPTQNDYQEFQLGDLWVIPKRNTPPSQEIWLLVSKEQNQAVWIQLGTSTVTYPIYETLTGSGTSVDHSVPTGSAGMVLMSNGPAAYPTFQSVGASGAIIAVNYLVASAAGAGVYTPTPGMVYCIIEILGAGAGAGGAASQANWAAYAGGGGSGGYVKAKFPAATIGVSQAFVLGAGGVGGTGNSTGGAGGDSTFGAFLTAGGGQGSTTLAVAVKHGWAQGGLGGSATGGDVNVLGYNGNYGFAQGGGSVNTSFVISGSGASSIYGVGGIEVSAESGSTLGINGNNATGNGSGGGGALGPTGGALSLTGGNGADGMIIITEFIA